MNSMVITKTRTSSKTHSNWLENSVTGFYGYDSETLQPYIKKINTNYDILFVNYKNSILGTGGVGTVTRDMAQDLHSLQMICYDHESNSTAETNQQIHLVDLEPNESKVFHSSYAKLYLWPILHGIETRYSEDEISALRSSVNSASKKFAVKAKEISAQSKKTPIYWVNDYVLVQSVGHLRSIDPESFIIFSWRTSFGDNEPPKLYTKDSNNIFKSLLKADLVSFHTKKDIRNFVELFLKSNQSKDIRFDYGKIAFVDKNNHHCYLRAVPMGSNPEYRRHLSKSIVSTDIKNNFEQVISSGKNVKIITSVSRFEISKGLEYELDIIEKLLQNHPELSEKFVFARYSYISKAKKHSFDYIQQYEKIINRITKINTKYRMNNWHPIHADFTKKLNDYEMTSLYRASDILLVASLSDGFNHISIEGPLSKVIEEDRPMQLALGRVGSAEYLTNYSQLGMANPIDDAEILTLLLNMDSEKIIESFKRLNASCKKLSAKIWYTSILYEVINPNAVPQVRINYKDT